MNNIPATPEKLGLAPIEEFPVYLDSDSIDKTKERYVFYPGNTISPRRLQETREITGVGLSWNGRPFRVTQNGGDEYHTASLTRTKGYVPRAFFTPLEVAANWIPPELLPYGADSFAPVAANGPQVMGGVLVGTRSQYLVGEKVFPGHALNWMLSFARNDQGFSRGLVEIPHLQGQKWVEGAAIELQKLFFPTYPIIPNVLSEMRRGLDAITSAQSGDIREIGELLLQACDEFREWGLNFVANEHNLVSVGTTKDGWTYRYSDTSRLLFDQLEITPQDQQFQTVAKMQEEQSRSAMAMMEAMAAKGNTDDDMKKMLMASIENQNRIMELLAQQQAPALSVAEPKPAKPAKS